MSISQGKCWSYTHGQIESSKRSVVSCPTALCRSQKGWQRVQICLDFWSRYWTRALIYILLQCRRIQSLPFCEAERGGLPISPGFLSSTKLLIQAGKICVPMCTKPGEPPSPQDLKIITKLSRRPTLTLVAKLLKSYHNFQQDPFDDIFGDSEGLLTNPVLKSWHKFVEKKKTRKEKHDSYSSWRKTLELPQDAHLDELLVDPQALLLADRTLSAIDLEERLLLVSGPGVVLLRLIAIQVILGEAVSVNGSMFCDLESNAVVLVNTGSCDALDFVCQSIETFDIICSTGDLMKFEAKFKLSHSRYDPAIEPITYRRVSPTIPAAIPAPTRLTSQKRKINLLQGDSALPEAVPRRSTRRQKGNDALPIG